MKIDVRPEDLPMLRMLLAGVASAAEDEKLLAMLRRLMKQVEKAMRTDGQEPKT
jgi:hypothetical protein